MLQTADVISELKKLIIKSEKPYDLDAVDRAITAACKAHEGQRRSSGEAYVCHPLKVACILVELGMDSETIEAAILHDVVEDTPMELADVQKHFGAEVATLVDGVTKIEKIPFSSREEQQAENVRKMLLAMSQDIRVIIIKLADRLHNMRTSDAWPPQKRRWIFTPPWLIGWASGRSRRSWRTSPCAFSIRWRIRRSRTPSP